MAITGTILVEHELHGLNEEEGGEHGEHGEEGHDDHGDHAGHGHEEHAVGRVKLTDEARKNGGIEVAGAGPGKVSVVLSLPGEMRLNADALSHVTPRISGTVREVKKKVGDAVKKGETLALLDSRELADITREARAATERVKHAEANLERIEKLHKDSIVAEKDLLLAKKELADAKIDRDAAGQALAAAGSAGGGSGYPLLAPFDGTIVQKHIAIGEVMKEDTRAFVVADLSKLWVEVSVFAKDLARVEVGQPARIRADGIAEPVVGKIDFISALASETTRSAGARIVLDRPGPQWKPGLFVTADVAIEETDAAVVVPDDAIMTIEGKSVVFVEEEGTFEARLVGLGGVGFSSKLAVVEILHGLKAGERYVTKGAFTIKAELGKGAAGHDH
jgi:cobalt-zinc-cadmium efflux system membrane fusion protein